MSDQANGVTKNIIEAAFEKRADITPANTDQEVRKAVESTLMQVDAGKIRVAEKHGSDWITNEWIKKAVLLSFRMNENKIIDVGATKYYDKVPTKFSQMTDDKYRRICRFRHYGGHLGYRWLLCTNWKECSLVRWRRHRWCIRTLASITHYY